MSERTGATDAHWIIRADPQFTTHEGGTVIVSGGTVYGDGYVIARAADVLTAEQRAAISTVLHQLDQSWQDDDVADAIGDTPRHRRRGHRMTEGTRTPAQQTWDAQQDEFSTVWGGNPVDRTVMARAEEVGTDVRALTATVESLTNQVVEHYDVFLARFNQHSERLAELEYQRDRAEADADDLEQIRSRVLPQSPGSAESAPEPVCVCCGFPVRNGRCIHCDYAPRNYVPSEQAVQEPPALDPVLTGHDRDLAIAALVDVAIDALGYFQDCVRRGADNSEFNLAENKLFPALDNIRAYGGDAREGGK